MFVLDACLTQQKLVKNYKLRIFLLYNVSVHFLPPFLIVNIFPRTIFQAVSHRFPSTEACILSQGNPQGICGRKSNARTGFSSITVTFPCQLSFYRSSFHIPYEEWLVTLGGNGHKETGYHTKIIIMKALCPHTED